MTKHDDDASETAEKQTAPFDNLVARYRELKTENAALQLELDRTRERLDYYHKLSVGRFGFVPEAPPGTFFNEE